MRWSPECGHRGDVDPLGSPLGSERCPSAGLPLPRWATPTGTAGLAGLPDGGFVLFLEYWFVNSFISDHFRSFVSSAREQRASETQRMGSTRCPAGYPADPLGSRWAARWVAS